MSIHHNTFECLGPWHANPIRIRGIPRDHCYINNNWFYYTEYPPVWQINSYGRITMESNLIGPPPNEVYRASGPIRQI
ncbi:hypothetical protein ASZ90_010821 [hydrocarbon metagenome]|uniref:Right handed beta helix domain-containing protein n=1 Tax=hydrocarbon metagenome TaxID=938273 RepID=A0A0W8FEY7_9ZZZZ